jgi:tetratricopeptide (TPR) repeat protein
MLSGCHKSSEDYYNDGLKYLSEGNNSDDDAIEAFKNSIGKDKNYFNSYLQLGKIYFNEGNYKLAIENLDYAHRISPNDTSCLDYLGMSMFEQNNFSNAIFFFNQAIKYYPHNQYFLYQSASSYYFNADYSKTSILCDTLIIINPQNSGYYLLKGRALIGLNKYDESKDYVFRAIELNPSIEYGYYCLALSYNYLNQLDSALYYAQKSFAQQKDFNSKFLLGSLYLLRTNNRPEYRKEFQYFIDYIDTVRNNNTNENNQDDDYEPNY